MRRGHRAFPEVLLEYLEIVPAFLLLGGDEEAHDLFDREVLGAAVLREVEDHCVGYHQGCVEVVIQKAPRVLVENLALLFDHCIHRRHLPQFHFFEV